MDSITTLIVEDEPMLAEILVDNIKQFPQFDVIGIADKLESARKQLRLYQPQLILLDNNMPQMNGVETLKRLRQVGYAGKILLFTVSDAEKDVRDALRFGADGYLHHLPFTNVPVADLWSLNAWMATRQQAHFQQFLSLTEQEPQP